jgi:hypothetical protein
VELLLSIVALVAGPLLFPVAKRHPRLLCGMDGFVLVAIAGLSLLHLLPVAIEHAGPWALITALLGVLGPFLFGRNLPHEGQRSVHNVFILVAVVGLAFHAMVDGAAIFHGTHSEDMNLGGMVAAVLIHRVPMSLLIWWALRPRMGIGLASGALGLLAVSTGAGYLLGGSMHFTPEIMGHLVAFVAGSLVHVVAHDTASELIPRHCHDQWHATYSAIGGAVAAVGLLFFGHMHHFEGAWNSFSELIVSHSPAILLGFGLLVLAVRIGVTALADDGGVTKPCGSEGLVPPNELNWLDWIDRVTPWLAVAMALVFAVQVVDTGAAHDHGEAAAHAWWQWAATAVLAGTFLVSYFRVGPRGMLAQLFPFEHDHDHRHHDHEHHDHDHHG